MDRMNYFQDFIENTDNVTKKRMKGAILDFENGSNLMYFQCLKAISVDAGSDVNFSKATCIVDEMNEMDDKEEYYGSHWLLLFVWLHGAEKPFVRGARNTI